jgi:hypothetical protein
MNLRRRAATRLLGTLTAVRSVLFQIAFAGALLIDRPLVGTGVLLAAIAVATGLVASGRMSVHTALLLLLGVAAYLCLTLLVMALVVAKIVSGFRGSIRRGESTQQASLRALAMLVSMDRRLEYAVAYLIVVVGALLVAVALDRYVPGDTYWQALAVEVAASVGLFGMLRYIQPWQLGRRGQLGTAGAAVLCLIAARFVADLGQYVLLELGAGLALFLALEQVIAEQLQQLSHADEAYLAEPSLSPVGAAEARVLGHVLGPDFAVPPNVELIGSGGSPPRARMTPAGTPANRPEEPTGTPTTPPVSP